MGEPPCQPPFQSPHKMVITCTRSTPRASRRRLGKRWGTFQAWSERHRADDDKLFLHCHEFIVAEQEVFVAPSGSGAARRNVSSSTDPAVGDEFVSVTQITDGSRGDTGGQGRCHETGVLDEIDHRTIAELTRDGRTSVTRVAENVHISGARVHRISRLTSEAVLSRFMALVDPVKARLRSSVYATPRLKQDSCGQLRDQLGADFVVILLGAPWTRSTCGPSSSTSCSPCPGRWIPRRSWCSRTWTRVNS
ncbi:AsnC-like helix-turn-helix protein [Arthrobacter sp. SLBN-100]|nr:AsnC-like helix-turn-helix protein [Arthrobacter sp. SLBN-100]